MQKPLILLVHVYFTSVVQKFVFNIYTYILMYISIAHTTHTHVYTYTLLLPIRFRVPLLHVYHLVPTLHTRVLKPFRQQGATTLPRVHCLCRDAVAHGIREDRSRLSFFGTRRSPSDTLPLGACRSFSQTSAARSMRI